MFDPGNLLAPPVDIAIDGEDPRALAVSADGLTVYAAIFESGNGSTVLGGGSSMAGGFPPNVVSDPSGPYGGVNPPPNDGANFDPPIKPGLPAPPKVGLIVRKDASGNWMDDNGGDWTDLVSGANAAKSGRPVGWDLLDHDVARIDADLLTVAYTDRLMNLNMALAVHPVSGEVVVAGTDATNEIRFEPVVSGTFVRAHLARVDGASGARLAVVDLNDHLDYTTSTVPQAERDKSIGDPRGIAWSPDGARGFVTGMGSNNVVVIDAAGARAGLAPTIEVGEGPTGIVHHPTADRLFVLNKFAASVSEIDTVLELEVACAPLFDPSPPAIRLGRRFLYGTHETSGLGQAACASCHIDAGMDRLAWDLGNPQGDMKAVTGQNLGANVPGLNSGFQPWHPMKGPMVTQSLRDIILKEPHHWRGDRDGIEEFNGAFQGLLGDDAPLTAAEMQAFEDMLATIHYPPNPHRNLDNSLPASLPLPEHRSAGRFSPKGTPLPDGDAAAGLAAYRTANLDASAFNCSSCHTLPTGLGTDTKLVGFNFQTIPPGPNGERHHMLVAVDGSTNVSMKVPQLRNMHEKVGFDTSVTTNRAGFGFLHDGSVDSMVAFLSEPVFSPTSDQMLADLTAMMLAFAGGQLPYGGTLEPPATVGLDSHAAVGRQTTVLDGASPAPGQYALLDAMKVEADQNDVGWVVKGRQGGIERGYSYVGGGTFQADRAAETVSYVTLRAAASSGNELTFTVVPEGSETRIGIDRDLDGVFDRDELDAGSDPADSDWVPGCGDILAYGAGCGGSAGIVPVLALSGCADAGGAMTFSLRKGLGGASAFVAVGNTQAAVPFRGCTFNVLPLLSLAGPVPLSPGGPGQGDFVQPFVLSPGVPPSSSLTLQALILDAGAAQGVSTTNGVELVIP